MRYTEVHTEGEILKYLRRAPRTRSELQTYFDMSTSGATALIKRMREDRRLVIVGYISFGKGRPAPQYGMRTSEDQEDVELVPKREIKSPRPVLSEEEKRERARQQARESWRKLWNRKSKDPVWRENQVEKVRRHRRAKATFEALHSTGDFHVQNLTKLHPANALLMCFNNAIRQGHENDNT